jgi:hypothetical protein
VRRLPPRWRRWLIGAAVTCLALELVYVVAAHLLLRGDTLSRLISKKPEKFRIEWTAAKSYFPGVVTVERLTLRGQSGSAQWYLAADHVRAYISLWRLALKTVHLRSAHTSGLDFRLRRRLDRPSAQGEDAEDGPRPTFGSEHYPEIPGLANPPDPRPEDLYPVPKKLKKPWLIDLGGIEVDGPVRVAVNRARLEGEGVVSGAMTYRLRDTIEVRRGNLELPSARLFIDSEVAIDALALDVTSRWRRFPAKGAKLAQILAGISGDFAIAGDIRTKASVPLEVVPGLPVWATGRLDCRLKLEAGALQPGSSYALRSDALRIGLLDLAAVGSAAVKATTRATGARPLTELAIDLDTFTLVDPADAAVGVQGSGLTVRATWDGLSLADYKPATSVDIVLPPTDIADVRVVGKLLPGQWGLDVAAGTGTVSGRLGVDAARQASGQLDLEARQLRVTTRGTPMRADLSVHATLARGDLKQRRFEVPEATVTIENAVNERPTKKDRGPWWCSLKLEQANLVLGSPLAAEGRLAVKMRDTRPIMAVIDEFSDPPKWFSLVPEVQNVDGSMAFTMDGAVTALREMSVTGESLQILGWLQLSGKKADGRIYAKYKVLAAGIGLDHGKSSIHVVKPQAWFDAQPTAAPASSTAGP